MVLTTTSTLRKAAFKVAGSMAIKEALRKSDPVILEPVMAVEVETPEEYTGFVRATSRLAVA